MQLRAITKMNKNIKNKIDFIRMVGRRDWEIFVFINLVQLRALTEINKVVEKSKYR